MHRAAENPMSAAQPDNALRDDVKYLLARVIRHLRKPGPHHALAEQVMSFLNRHRMTFSPLRSAGAEDQAEDRPAAAQKSGSPTAPDRSRLRELVDLTWGRAMEDTSVPATSLADAIIDDWQLGEESLMPSTRAPDALQAPAPAGAALEHDAIANVLGAMLQSLDDETATLGAELALDPRLADALEAARNLRPSHFHLHLVYRQERMSDAVLSAADVPHKARWLFKNYLFAKSHVQHVIEIREGSMCCVDKASTILSAWLHFELTGQRIAFDYDAQYTFHLPREVLCSHDEIVGFCEGLRMLHNGRPEQYLKSLRTLLSPADSK